MTGLQNHLLIGQFQNIISYWTGRYRTAQWKRGFTHYPIRADAGCHLPVTAQRSPDFVMVSATAYIHHHVNN